MACRFMLILCGDTYTSRLWCVWELFTLFAFASLETAVHRLTIYPLANENVGIMENLLLFDVKNAHCYDPNEEKKLRSVIEANGDVAFNNRVQALARKSLDHQLAEKKKAPSNIFVPFNISTTMRRAQVQAQSAITISAKESSNKSEESKLTKTART